MADVRDLASFCAAVSFEAEDLLHITDGELAELLEEYDVKGIELKSFKGQKKAEEEGPP